jgi:hypothetical protein
MIILRKDATTMHYFIFGMRFHAYKRFIRKYATRVISRAEYRTLQNTIKLTV